MSNLSAAQNDELRKILTAERERLLVSARSGLELSMNRERTSVGRDSIDESMEEELFSTELRLRDREQFLLHKINTAIERLDQGTIDECGDCGEAIGFRRLLVRPMTTLCIDCKELEEAEEAARAQGGGVAAALTGGESGAVEAEDTP